MSPDNSRSRNGSSRRVYSPQISPELIPVLYRTARAKAVPMTSLVDALLYKALAVENMPDEARSYLAKVGHIPALETAIGAGGLEKMLRNEDVAPFADEREIDAWYRGSEYGLMRLQRLYESRGTTPDSTAPDHLKVLALLKMFRSDGKRMVARNVA